MYNDVLSGTISAVGADNYAGFDSIGGGYNSNWNSLDLNRMGLHIQASGGNPFDPFDVYYMRILQDPYS
jgi:hypothetical protein